MGKEVQGQCQGTFLAPSLSLAGHGGRLRVHACLLMKVFAREIRLVTQASLLPPTSFFFWARQFFVANRILFDVGLLGTVELRGP